MLMTEWNWDDALAVRYEEGMEEGLERGLEQGLERGLEQGLEQGLERGRADERYQIARNALAKGLPIETVQEITGLSMDEIANL